MPSELEKLVAELRAVAAEAEKLRPRLVRHAGLVREFAAEIAADPDGRSMPHTQAASLLHQAGRQCDALAAELGRAKVAADHFAGRVLSGGGASSAEVAPAPADRIAVEPAAAGQAVAEQAGDPVDAPPDADIPATGLRRATKPRMTEPGLPDGELPPVPHQAAGGAVLSGFTPDDLALPAAAGTEPKGGFPRGPRMEEARERENERRPAVPPARVPIRDTSRDVVNKFAEAGETSPNDLPQALVDERSFWMDQCGHAILRHAEIPDLTLIRRVLFGEDPITGTTTDWESGKKHPFASHATTFTSRRALVFAEAKVWASAIGSQDRAEAEHGAELRFTTHVRVVDVFGQNYREHLRGWSRLGPKKDPTGMEPTAFGPDTRLTFHYRRESVDTPWFPTTAYPEP